MQEEGEQRKSRSAIDTANDAIGKAKTAYKGARFLVGGLSLGWTIALVFGAILILVIVVIITSGGGAGADPSPEEEEGSQATGTLEPPVPGLSIEKSGPSQVPNSTNISYTIKVSYEEDQDVTIADPLPPNVTFVSATCTFTRNGSEVLWKLNENNTAGCMTESDGSKNYSFGLTVLPNSRDILVVNRAIARAPLSGSYADVSGLFPSPLPPVLPEAEQAINGARASLEANPQLLEIYQEASLQTGVPWPVLAGIHYIEGGMNINNSLVSGRPIGGPEPDVRTCSSQDSGPGKPVPLAGGGCGFNTIEDTAIYAGNHLSGKIGRTPATFEDAVTALSRYNGGGNRNCGRGGESKTPYPHCPELFEGESDIYPLNFFDERHQTMYLVYCADYTPCSPPQVFQRPGVLTIARGFLES